MNKIAPIGIILAFVAIAVAFIPKPVITDEGDSEATHINWVSMEKVEELIMTKPRPVLVDVYTDWCGWCKKMDKDTYEDSAIVEYINEHFYAVKFDAEQKEDVVLGGRTYKFRADQGRRGVHELAVAMLNGKMSYPQTVFFDNELKMITPLAGYQNAKNMLPILNFIDLGVYKESSDLQGYMDNFYKK